MATVMADGVAAAPRSTGFAAVAAPGAASAMAARAAGGRGGVTSPAVSAASAARTLTPPAVPLIAIPSPAGGGSAARGRGGARTSPSPSQRTAPGWRGGGGEGGPHPYRRVGVEYAETVRSDQPDPVAPCGADQFGLRGLTGVAVLAEPGGQHNGRTYPGLSTVDDRVQYGGRRYRD